jgi:hypothetical protein
LELRCHGPKACERRLEALDDFRRDLVGRGQEVGIVESVVFEPEEVEIELVARDQCVEGELPETLRLNALIDLARAVAGDKLLLGYYTDDGKLIYAGRAGTGTPTRSSLICGAVSTPCARQAASERPGAVQNALWITSRSITRPLGRADASRGDQVRDG